MRRAALRVCLALAALTGSQPARAQFDPLGTEIRANTTTANAQFNPQARVSAVAPNRSFLVAWTSLGQDPDGSSGVYAQFFDGDGFKVGPEVRIPESPDGDEFLGEVAAAPDSTFLLVYRSASTGRLLLRRYSDQGVILASFVDLRTGRTVLSPEIQANATTAPTNNGLIGVDAAGNFVVVWTGLAAGQTTRQIFFRRFAATGEPLDAEERQIEPAAPPGVEVRARGLAVAASGDFALTWTRVSSSGESRVLVQAFRADGVPMNPAAILQVAGTLGGTNPAMAMTADSGKFAMAWETITSEAGQTDVVLQRFDAAGLAEGPSFQVNTFTPGRQGSPVIAADSAGNFVIAWASGDQDGTPESVFAQAVGSQGRLIGVETQINFLLREGFQRPRSASFGQDGFLVVAFDSQPPEGGLDGSDVYVQRYNPIAFPAPVTLAAWPTEIPSARAAACFLSEGSFTGETAVTLDGAPASYQRLASGILAVSLPPLASGSHQLALVTGSEHVTFTLLASARPSLDAQLLGLASYLSTLVAAGIVERGVEDPLAARLRELAKAITERKPNEEIVSRAEALSEFVTERVTEAAAAEVMTRYLELLIAFFEVGVLGLDPDTIAPGTTATVAAVFPRPVDAARVSFRADGGLTILSTSAISETTFVLQVLAPEAGLVRITGFEGNKLIAAGALSVADVRVQDALAQLRRIVAGSPLARARIGNLERGWLRLVEAVRVGRPQIEGRVQALLELSGALEEEMLRFGTGGNQGLVLLASIVGYFETFLMSLTGKDCVVEVLHIDRDQFDEPRSRVGTPRRLDATDLELLRRYFTRTLRPGDGPLLFSLLQLLRSWNAPVDRAGPHVVFAGQAQYHPIARTANNVLRIVLRVRPRGRAFWVRILDPDDPSSDVKPVDPNGSAGNDNRGYLDTDQTKDRGFAFIDLDNNPQTVHDARPAGRRNVFACGLKTPLEGGFAGLFRAFPTTDVFRAGRDFQMASDPLLGLAVFDLGVALQPGDNYQFRVACTQPELDVAPNRPAEPITIWRLLHVERDRMRSIAEEEEAGTPDVNQPRGAFLVELRPLADGRTSLTPAVGFAGTTGDAAKKDPHAAWLQENGAFERSTLRFGITASPQVLSVRKEFRREEATAGEIATQLPLDAALAARLHPKSIQVGGALVAIARVTLDGYFRLIRGGRVRRLSASVVGLELTATGSKVLLKDEITHAEVGAALTLLFDRPTGRRGDVGLELTGQVDITRKALVTASIVRIPLAYLRDDDDRKLQIEKMPDDTFQGDGKRALADAYVRVVYDLPVGADGVLAFSTFWYDHRFPESLTQTNYAKTIRELDVHRFAQSRPEYWVAHTLGAHQGLQAADNDPPTEPATGVTVDGLRSPGGLLVESSIEALVDTEPVPKGGGLFEVTLKIEPAAMRARSFPFDLAFSELFVLDSKGGTSSKRAYVFAATREVSYLSGRLRLLVERFEGQDEPSKGKVLIQVHHNRSSTVFQEVIVDDTVGGEDAVKFLVRGTFIHELGHQLGTGHLDLKVMKSAGPGVLDKLEFSDESLHIIRSLSRV